MTAIELKNIIIAKIQLIENVELLKETSLLIDIEIEDFESPYILTEDMNNAVSDARTQIKKGNFLSHSQANQEIEEWLDK